MFENYVRVDGLGNYVLLLPYRLQAGKHYTAPAEWLGFPAVYGMLYFTAG